MIGTTGTFAGRLAAAACCGALLLACTARQPLARHTAPVPAVGADGYYAIGRAAHAAGRYDAARRAWDAALRLDPPHADTRNGMAVLLAGQGRYGEAITLWRALVEDGRTLPAAGQALLLGNLGHALYLRGDRDEALGVLGKACLLDPYRPLAWEQLAAVLEALGQPERARQMMEQARALRTQGIRRDDASTGERAPAAPVPAVEAPGPWPQGIARIELRQAGAVIEVHRVAAAAAQPPLPLAESGDGDGGNGDGGNGKSSNGLRLEISNGNGERGMAAAWKQRLAGPQWKSVRLTNAKSYAVAVTRIEYRGDANAAGAALALARRLGLPAPRMLAEGAAGMDRADLRIVLGRDRRGVAAPAGEMVAQGAVQVP
jgi:tetratricopeptide (TPR) repeat protein